jgi:hypothetical protein
MGLQQEKKKAYPARVRNVSRITKMAKIENLKTCSSGKIAVATGKQ